MYSLDAPTVGLIYALLSIGLAAFVAIASRQAEGQRGFAEWTLASVSLAAAFPINFLQTELPLGFAIGVSNFLFMLGWCFHYCAIRTFFGHRHARGMYWKWPWLVALFHGVLMTWLAVGMESVAARLFVFNGAGMLTMALAALAVRTPAHGALRTAARLTRSIFALTAMLYACRVLWFAFMGTPSAVTAAISIQIYVGLALSLLQIGATFSFLLMQNFRLNDELRAQADLDVLTGLFNRRGLDLRARRLLARTHTAHGQMAFILLDIDHFKQINDTHGHPVGDQVLCWLAEKLPELLRPNDLLGRYGGEEFVALLPDADLATAKKVAERMRASIAAETPEFDGVSIRITLSLGISLAKDANYELDACLAQADTGLYIAKNAGRNQISYFPPEQSTHSLQFV
jgi:diguanylate cyclase (GGDEF)-like protein